MVTIADAEGAVLPGAVIALTGPVGRQATADAHGHAEFVQLPPGRYRLTAKLFGFADYVASVDVTASTQLRHHVVTRLVGWFDPARGRNVLEQIVTGCNVPSPATLPESWASAAAVSHVRVEGQRSELVHGSSSGTVITRSSVRIREVFKSPVQWPAAGALAEIVQVGGELDRGDYIQITSQSSFPLLGIGREYVLFLNNAETRGWTVAFCADGAFELAANRVAPVGPSEFSRMWRGKESTAFIDALRNHASQAQAGVSARVELPSAAPLADIDITMTHGHGGCYGRPRLLWRDLLTQLTLRCCCFGGLIWQGGVL
ncbi:MAG TPA: carboxypeptidase-like regulatory domain-containing protein [Vicinamibacterales bacterium]|nr:carboxypeptidase-like regulatory domain-containing protein [Vicinamibacterales bacterium]